MTLPPKLHPTTKEEWICAGSSELHTTQMTLHFIERTVRELNFYMKESSTDELMAIMLHPLVMVSGVTFLVDHKVISTEEVTKLKDDIKLVLWNLYRPSDRATSSDDCVELDPSGASVNEELPTTVNESSAIVKANPFLRHRAKKAKTDKVGPSTARGDVPPSDELLLKQTIDFEVDSYVIHFGSLSDEDWRRVVTEFPSQVLLDEIEAAQSNPKTATAWQLVPGDPVYSGERLDVLKFWKSLEKTYPRISVLACIILGKPFTNAFQERVFSLGTWMETALNQSMHDTTFEMRMLCKANRSLIEKEFKATNKTFAPTVKEEGSIEPLVNRFKQNTFASESEGALKESDVEGDSVLQVDSDS
jgi:hypothetical protein